MTTPAQTAHRSIATLKLVRSVPALITQAENIVKAMTSNAAFPSPTPPLTTVTDAVNELQAAETATLSRTKGAATVRDEKRNALIKQLQQLKSYVQTTADASIETSASIVQSAGIAVKKTSVRSPRVFTAKPGAVSGSVALVARSAARRASYEWQYSIDAGKTWLAAPNTLQSRTTISGLTPGATVSFRYRAVTKVGEGDWSQPSSLIVQ
jgi:hypothetical protein